ncbi:hypothetical protein B0H14DRAFT_2587594 [Mycena olivaceomarginata]|nr:hypothetical protein B0H14DRAFT_2587594 [Mycena olivaceomarginata]
MAPRPTWSMSAEVGRGWPRGLDRVGQGVVGRGRLRSAEVGRGCLGHVGRAPISAPAPQHPWRSQLAFPQLIERIARGTKDKKFPYLGGGEGSPPRLEKKLTNPGPRGKLPRVECIFGKEVTNDQCESDAVKCIRAGCETIWTAQLQRSGVGTGFATRVRRPKRGVRHRETYLEKNERGVE